MGMPVEFNTMIVTKGNEQRIEENMFQLTKEGYRIYPIDIPIEVRKTIEGEIVGKAIVEKLQLAENKTVVTYRLLALNSTN
ncbi:MULTISPECIES: DUF2584 domain-containing protein [Metabacillus]|jgi:hypothetical protein|uniref:DUF2584 domain-containing protein n=1 Tax=Metabacillus rhizolycopersici TaxID=2875709 RepID=A0ABS7UTF9_9BACI|nr:MULTISPECIES: DUF2584 domain-containing protein [Metabacillus]MBZ5751576.1 DUF2584 domain-containing protein [Metabacillus rhizolycopersici]MCM3650850.1 DUF2584 domain-containing protein [Metabacillus litoralis]